MMTKRIRWEVVVLLVTAWIVPVAALAASNSAATGVIGSLSPATRTLTIQKNDGSQVLLRTTERSVLTRNGKRVGFAALALRDQVTVQLQRSLLVRLDARGPALDSARGVFTSFDAASSLLTMATLGGSRSFRVGGTTLIERNGAATTAQGLARGDALLVHAPRAAAGALATAADVEADGPEEEGVEGTITAISGQDVAITPEHGSAVTVHVSAATQIRIHDAGGTHSAALADLATGMQAEADFDPVSMVADHLVARAAEHHEAEVEGAVTAVDATAGTISIAPEHGGADVSLHTDATTRISRDGAVATLADVRVGDTAEARYDASAMLASRLDVHSETQHQHAQVEGMVTALTAGSVTISPEHGAAVTLTVDTTTSVFVSDRPATFADVHTGQRAHAAYDATTLVASVLRVQDEGDQEDAEVEGAVTAVSTTSITIAPEHGGTPVTLTLDGSTHIVRDGNTATAADLRVGDRADAAYLRATLLATRIEARSGEGGDH